MRQDVGYVDTSELCIHLFWSSASWWVPDQLRHYRKPQHAARQWNRPRCRAIPLTRGPWWWCGFHSCLYTRVLCHWWNYPGCCLWHDVFSRWLQWVAYTSDIAISSWCSTERQGDTSESVVFHFLLLGVWDRCLFVCVWLLCFACFVFWFPQTPCFPFHLFSNKWE